MGEKARRAGRKLVTDPDLLPTGMPQATRELVAALNTLLVEAGSAYVAVLADERLAMDSKQFSRQMRKPHGPDSHVVAALLRHCARVTGQPLEALNAKITPLVERARRRTSHVQLEDLPESGSPGLRQETEWLLELLWSGDTETAAEGLSGVFCGNVDNVATALTEVGKRDLIAVAYLLDALEDEAFADEVANTLGQRDEELAAAIGKARRPRSTPATESEQPAEPKTVLDLDPTVGVGRRHAAMLRRGHNEIVEREIFGAAPDEQDLREMLTDKVGASVANRLARIAEAAADGPQLVAQLVAYMVDHEHADHAVVAVAATARYWSDDEAATLLTTLPPSSYHVIAIELSAIRNDHALTLLLAFSPRDELTQLINTVVQGRSADESLYDTAVVAVRHRVDQGDDMLISDLICELVVDECGDVAAGLVSQLLDHEPILANTVADLPTATLAVLVGHLFSRAGDALPMILAALSEAVAVEILTDPFVVQHQDLDPRALLEALPDLPMQLPAMVEANLEATRRLISRALTDWDHRIALPERHEPCVQLVQAVIALSRSHAEHALMLFEQLLVKHPFDAATLLYVAESNVDARPGAAALLAAVLTGRPHLINHIADLPLTNVPLPMVLFEKLVTETPAIMVPVLRALVERQRAEVRRLLPFAAQETPAVAQYLLEILIERDPAGPWAYAQDALSSRMPTQMRSILEAYPD